MAAERLNMPWACRELTLSDCESGALPGPQVQTPRAVRRPRLTRLRYTFPKFLNRLGPQVCAKIKIYAHSARPKHISSLAFA